MVAQDAPRSSKQGLARWRTFLGKNGGLLEMVELVVRVTVSELINEVVYYTSKDFIC